MEKKIIGYKLAKPKYEQAAMALVDSKTDWKGGSKIVFVEDGTWYNKFKEADVLDLWFEPVYEEEKPINIRGYEAKRVGDEIKFGCKGFSREDLISYKKLFDSEIDGSITIDGQNINTEIIDKLLKMLS